MSERGERARASAALEASNRHVIRARLADARRYSADADLGHELHRNARPRIGVLEIVDQLRQILDRVDVMVRRWRDKTDSRGRVAHPGDDLVDLAPRQLA